MARIHHGAAHVATNTLQELRSGESMGRYEMPPVNVASSLT
jgi:hypothetical protein